VNSEGSIVLGWLSRLAIILGLLALVAFALRVGSDRTGCL